MLDMFLDYEKRMQQLPDAGLAVRYELTMNESPCPDASRDDLVGNLVAKFIKTIITIQYLDSVHVLVEREGRAVDPHAAAIRAWGAEHPQRPIFRIMAHAEAADEGWVQVESDGTVRPSEEGRRFIEAVWRSKLTFY